MNGLVESLLRSELFHRIPKTFEEAVEIALKEEFSQASAQGKSAGSDQWDMEVSSMEQFPQREAYRVPASAPPSQRPCFECNQLAARLSTPQEHAPPTTSEDALPSACASKTSAVAASLWKIPWLEGRPEPSGKLLPGKWRFQFKNAVLRDVHCGILETTQGIDRLRRVGEPRASRNDSLKQGDAGSSNI
ncbi:unnamed protein product [Aphanomyces euteiches]